MERWIIILGFSMLMLFSACKNESSGIANDHDTFKPKGELSDLVHNPVRPDGTVDSSYLPVITWKEVVYDYGTVNEGDVVTKEFSFTNTGTGPLLILNATSTCGCTIPEWSKEPIPPQHEGSIRVRFNTLHKHGAQIKEVTIFANTFPNQSKITLKGQVQKAN